MICQLVGSGTRLQRQYMLGKLVISKVFQEVKCSELA